MVYKLYYFPGRGWGESTRQMFKLANEDFEDIRITQEEWPKHKPDMPFGQMPVLEVDGKQIPQSAALGRFVARKLGFAGKTPFEMAWVDAIIDQFKDHYSEISPWFYAHLGFREGNKDELYKSVYIPARDKFYKFITKILKDNNTGWLVGDSVTWADLAIADHVTSILKAHSDELKDFPEVLAHKNRVDNIPEIKAWIAVRPDTPY